MRALSSFRATAIAALIVSAPLSAARSTELSPGPSWTGCYVGGNGGIVRIEDEVTAGPRIGNRFERPARYR